MRREFLEGLGLGKSAIEAIMGEHGRGIEAYKSRCEAAEAAAEAAETAKKELNAQLESAAALNADKEAAITALTAEKEELSAAFAAEKEAVSASFLAEKEAMGAELSSLKEQYAAFREGVITELVAEANPSSSLAREEIKRRLFSAEDGNLRATLQAMREEHPDAFLSEKEPERPLFTAFAGTEEAELSLTFPRRHR